MAKKLNIVICDDDIDFAKTLYKNVQAILILNNIEADISIIINPIELIVKLQHPDEKEYDIVFLDIEMPNMSGIDVAKKINSLKKQTKIIFVTYQDNYIFDLQDIKHVWFVRKSHLIDDLEKSVNMLIKVKYKISKSIDCIHNGKAMSINTSDVFMIETGDKNYLKIYTVQGEISECRCTVSVMENLLNDVGFIRIKQDALVNFKFIDRIEKRKIVILNIEKIEINLGGIYKEKAVEKYMDLRMEEFGW